MITADIALSGLELTNSSFSCGTWAVSNFAALCRYVDIISSLLSFILRYKSKEIINTDDDLSTDTDEEKPLKPKYNYTTIWWQLYDDSTQNQC